MIAVIDCNNFFVSCERVFRPELQDKPVAVLSNNDGCFVARSNEVKQLGIPMGAAAFEYQTQIKQHNIQLFSANFTLYGDISHRVMTTIREHAPETEVYSIDEAFIELSDINKQTRIKFAEKLRADILQWVGIPVSIGIAPTKTLAKAANERAKKDLTLNGVLDISDEEEIQQLLREISIRDVWGIGRNLNEFLHRYGIYSALDLKNANDRLLKQQQSIVLQRTVLELKGIACIPIAPHQPEQKTIITSRTFGTPVENKLVLQKAVAAYCSRAAEKLRKQRLRARSLSLFIRTSRFQKDDTYYYKSLTVDFPEPTSYTPVITHHAMKMIDEAYLHGYRYKQAGITLHNLMPRDHVQQNLFSHEDHDRHDQVMQAVDKINHRWGTDSVHTAISGTNQLWSTKQSQRSPSYTTRWDQLPQVRL
ncbi:Y-family DNA polymerase [candidate division WWE3 bacterium]|uniref:Y-family DNA polymerase n=1 Tax=candidate division WWE3 bacterium TaxID=2053526 RepID=A0A955LG39_UNCKA|nr:Y-family DNA polymerase [candidate division WWE3 bacterium]